MKPRTFLLGLSVLLIVIILPSFFINKHSRKTTVQYVADKVTYNPDNSITFHGVTDEVTFNENQLPKLEKILEKADALDKECSKTLKIDTEIILDSIDNHIFRYMYTHDRLSMLGISTNYDFVGIYQKDKYISYLTTYKVMNEKERSRYGKEIEKLNEIKKKLDIK